MSVRVFLEQIRILISQVNKLLSPMWEGIIRSFEGSNRTKRVNVFSLLEQRHSSSAMGHQHFWVLGFQTKTYAISPQIFEPLESYLHHGLLLVLRSLDSDWIRSPVPLVLQIAYGRCWDLLSSVIAWPNSYNKYPLRYFLLVWFLWKMRIKTGTSLSNIGIILVKHTMRVNNDELIHIMHEIDGRNKSTYLQQLWCLIVDKLLNLSRISLFIYKRRSIYWSLVFQACP